MNKNTLFFRRYTRGFSILPGILILIFFTVAPASAAEIIYYDNFDGPAGTELNGTTPDISGGETWAAGSNFSADGTITFDNSSMGDSAYLPFVPLDGYIYELSAKIDTRPSPYRGSAGVNDWIALGFTSSNDTPGARFYDDAGTRNPVYWGMTRTNECTINQDQTFVGPGTANGAATGTTSVDDIKIVLDTTEAVWVVSWYYDGDMVRTVDVADSLKPNFQYIAISNARADGIISELLLTWRMQLQADEPNPANESLVGSTEVTLQWQPGIYAQQHDVYIGVDFDDVNNATVSSAEIYKGRQGSNSYLAGGLVPGQTYYWRIDEVGGSPDYTIYKGNIWSFTIQPLTAYNPNPADGDKYLDIDLNLTWSPGFGAQRHNVYFGTDPEPPLVREGSVAATYNPGTLNYSTTYYWRIGENDGENTHTGDVWSFSTEPDIPVSDPNLVGWWKLDEGEGTKALDWSGLGNHGTLINGPQWRYGNIDGALLFDGLNDQVSLPIGPVVGSLASSTFGVWVNYATIGDPWQGIFDFGTGTDVYMYLSPTSGWGNTPMQFGITAAGAEEESQLIAPSALASGWHHIAVVLDDTSDIMSLYLDGSVIASDAVVLLPQNLGETTQNWIGRMQNEANTYFIGFIDDFRIYNKASTQEEIRRIMTGDPVLAWNPKPANESASEMTRADPISWNAGDNAFRHDVYFGTDRTAVIDADASDTSGIYRGSQDSNSYSPPEGFDWGATYYWRIDEIDADSIVSKGRVWSFSVLDYLIVDDFESYNDLNIDQVGSNRIYMTWTDGYDNPTVNGSTMGYPEPIFADGEHFVETDIVHGGIQSAPLFYDNSVASYSEVTANAEDLAIGKDWTVKGVGVLRLWFYGDPNNAATEQLYVKLNDSKITYDGDANNLTKTEWIPWDIALSDFGIALTNVTQLDIGLERTGITGGKGVLYIDDILLYPPEQ
ncbi:MAG: hypothetical protein JW715_06145 [Sedimentisphaerales bacterium]|nr:hypothetical protein [Sedimentisphaerales bacterium]